MDLCHVRNYDCIGTYYHRPITFIAFLRTEIMDRKPWVQIFVIASRKSLIVNATFCALSYIININWLV